MELHELHIGHRHPGPQGHGQTVAGGLGRVGGHREELPDATGGQHGVAGPHLHHPPTVVEGQHPVAPTALHQQVEGEPLLQHGGGAGPGGIHQRPLHLGAGGRPAGVHHPGGGVATLAGQGQGTSGLPVELRPHGDQLLDPGRAFVHQDPDGVGVAEAGPGGQGVGQVEIGGVLVPTQHRRHAALGPPGGGPPQLGLGQHADPEAGSGARAAFDPAGAGRQSGGGQAHGGRQARHPAAQDQDVEVDRRRGRRSGRSAHAWDRLSSSTSRRAVASSMMRLVRSTWTIRGANCSSSASS